MDKFSKAKNEMMAKECFLHKRLRLCIASGAVTRVPASDINLINAKKTKRLILGSSIFTPSIFSFRRCPRIETKGSGENKREMSE